jgi:hypothetical protein
VQFVVLTSGQREDPSPQTFILEPKDWDDHGFRTLFELYYRDEENVPRYIGQLKIGQVSTSSTPQAVILPIGFEQLDQWHFSLGQDSSYYERLNDLGHEVRHEVLRALNDIASDPALFARAMSQSVTTISLLSNVPVTTVRNQFHRLAMGGARLSQYGFTFSYPEGGPHLSFAVIPESQPPSNVHVIIGRNGVGKSRLLNTIAGDLLWPTIAPTPEGINFDAGYDTNVSSQFANLVSVAFSAFDEFEPLSIPQGRRGVSVITTSASRRLRLLGQARLAR